MDELWQALQCPSEELHQVWTEFISDQVQHQSLLTLSVPMNTNRDSLFFEQNRLLL